MLKINKISKSYGDNEVLKEISVNFVKGNIYGIIGHNGAGKSTFFRCICQLEKYKGEISFIDSSPLRMEVNYLPTNPFFYPKITGKEYLTFFKKINTKSRDINIYEWNKLFQLPLNKYVEEYSSGMKKKISFFGILLLT